MELLATCAASLLGQFKIRPVQDRETDFALFDPFELFVHI